MNAVADEPPALDMVEESFDLVRAAGMRAHLAHLAGTLPFAVALLHFTEDSSLGWGTSALASSALGLAFMFIFMKACHARHSHLLREAAGFAAKPRHFLADLLREGALQPLGLLVLPLTFLAVLPFPSSLAFFHQAPLSEPGDPLALRLRTSTRGAWLLGKGQMIFLVLWLFLLLNLWVLECHLGPTLLKSLLDIETPFSMGVASRTSATAILVPALLAWVGLDPFLKAFHTLHHCRVRALTSGEDIEVALRREGP